MAFRDQPLGELALTIPRASALFRQYDMDYCCGGKQTLRPMRTSSITLSFAITTGIASSCRS